MGGCRHWCFTINNYSEEDIAVLDSFACEYIIYGKEVGENGTPHLQGYVCLTNRKGMPWMKKNFHKTAHLEQKRGTVKQAIEYCKKDGDVTERGTEPEEQSAKGVKARQEKYQRIIQLARDGRMDELAEDEPYTYLQFHRTLTSLFTCDKKWLDQCRGIWIYGRTGCGKTSAVMKACENGYYEKPPRNKWWDGYKGER